MKRNAPWTSVLAPLILCFGCDDLQDSLDEPKTPTDDVASDSPQPAGVPECSAAPAGRAYVDFGGTDLASTRANEASGVNRRRLKPFSVLAAEYGRILGAVPAGLASQAASFSQSPARGFVEPTASGVGLSALYSASFDAALTYAKAQPRFAVAPGAASARLECASFISRVFVEGSSEVQVDDCVKLAQEKLSNEPIPQRKWAYLFAGIMTSSGFLTY